MVIDRARVGLVHLGFYTNFKIVIGKYLIEFDDAANKINKLKFAGICTYFV